MSITTPRRRTFKDRLRFFRRVVVAIVGSTILLIGVVMIALPGPSILVIPFGLAILATEFLWARKVLEELKRRMPKRRKRSTPKS